MIKMKNMSDGKTDGLALVYIKDKIAYPIALNKDQLQMLDCTLGVCLNEIKLINNPIGSAINLIKNKK